MRITQKIGVLVAVPLCAVSGFGALALVTSTSGAIETGHLYTLMHAGAAAGDLVCELQDERTQVALYLTSTAGADAAALNEQIGKTQAAAAVFRDRVKSMPWLAEENRALLDRIGGELTAIDRLRDLVRGGSPQALSAADFQYHIVIADLLAFHDVAQKSGAASRVQDMLRATANLSQARESLSEEEADVLRIAGAPTQTASAAQDLVVGRTGYTGAMEAFAAVAPPKWRGVPDQVLGGAALARAGELEDEVAHTPIGTKVQLDPKAWTGTIDARLDRLDGVRKDMDLETLAMIAADRTHQRELAGVEAAAVAGTVLLAVVVSLRLGRPIIRGLRRLRDGAHTLAFEDLPAAVQELRGSGSLTAQTPEEFADSTGAGLPVTGDDEIAAVARAFNAVRYEAIRTAAEQVLLRAGVGAAFVALARRGERLTGALTLELDRAERDEQDPDRLARLFVLDHLAARMTRNNESLLVLGGEGTVRIRDQGVPLVDVIRAASGRIERYSRVDLVNVDLSVIIMPTVVDHLVHLLAELLDNATTFSPPDTRVVVDVTVLADRIILQITDRGIGMTAVRRSQLNARLTTPTHLDAASVKAMGLTVVGQLASWYGIAVELRPHPLNGTIAELVLPPTLYRAPSVAEPAMSTPTAAIETLASGMGWAGAARPAARTANARTAAASGGRRRRTSAAPADEAGLSDTMGGSPRHAGRPPALPQEAATAWNDEGSLEGSSPVSAGMPTAGASMVDDDGMAPASPAGAPADGTGTAPGGPRPGTIPLPEPGVVPMPRPGVAPIAMPTMGASGQFTLRSLNQGHDPGEPAVPYPSAPIRARSLNGEDPAQNSWRRGSMRTREPAAPARNGATRSAFEPVVAANARPAGRAGSESGFDSGFTPGYPPATAPAVSQTEPEPEPARPQIKLRTAHGLPKRVPLDRLPAEALTDPSQVEAAPAERDPSRVSASMTAYVRGIGGRGAPGVSQIPYTPSPNSGTH